MVSACLLSFCSKEADTYHRLPKIQRRLLLNSEFEIKRLARSVVNKLKRSSVARDSVDEFGRSTKAARNFALIKKGIGFDDQTNQVHIMIARSDMGISKEGLQMHLIHTEWLSGGIFCSSNGDENNFPK